jgi:hypothetical protein
MLGPLVTELFRRRAEGTPIVDLGRFMESRGVQTVRGNSRWPYGSVRTILKHRVYLGEARSGEFINTHAHPPLTDEATWQRAQHPSPLERTGHGNPHLLSGVLRCAGCRHRLMPTHGNGLWSYHCRRHFATGDCGSGASILATVIEPFVEEEFFIAVGRSEPRRRAAERAIRGLEAKHAASSRALTAYRDNPRIIEQIGNEAFADGLGIRQRRVDRAAGGLETALDIARTAPRPSREWRDVWPHLTVLERRNALLEQFDCVFVRHGRGPARKTYFCLRGKSPTDLPSSGRTDYKIKPFEFPRDHETLARKRARRLSSERRAIREEKIAVDLRKALAGESTWPSPPRLAELGGAGLHRRVVDNGGAKRWASRLGIPYRMYWHWEGRASGSS